MKVLLNNEWQDGFLDYHQNSGECRIKVIALANLMRLDGLYFVRDKSLALIWNYLHEIGPREVLRKVLSRSGERFRNQKFMSCGVGRVVDPPAGGNFKVGKLVAFLAPCHPPCLERLVLPTDLLVQLDESFEKHTQEDSIAYLPCAPSKEVDPILKVVRGWSGYSGERLPESSNLMMRAVVDMLVGMAWDDARRLPVVSASDVREIRNNAPAKQRKHGKKTVLFGYGNYAKTVIIPNIREYISLDCVHEVDPLQIPEHSDISCAWDVSPLSRPDESYEVFLIAGYHHTHAPLAVEALQRGAYAVVEKPIVVDHDQHSDIVNAVAAHGEKLFSCFHKRYLPFNRYAIEDLAVHSGEPVSYHCIVYEVPLPALHWYRWPNSKSRLTSNGCHWIDHCLYLNGFSRHCSMDVFVDASGTINASMILENGALFTMVLTDKGSNRIGVQDYIELRAGNVTVKMTNGSEYAAENGGRIIRKARINKMQSYRNMYRDIGKAISEGGSGDTVGSIRASNSAVLELERIYLQKRFDS